MENEQDEKAGQIVDGEGIASEQLEALISRIEFLEKEKQDISVNIREIYLEAKSQGFDPKIMRKIVRLRTMDPQEVDEEEVMVHLYKQALGMVV